MALQQPKPRLEVEEAIDAPEVNVSDILTDVFQDMVPSDEEVQIFLRDIPELIDELPETEERAEEIYSNFDIRSKALLKRFKSDIIEISKIIKQKKEEEEKKRQEEEKKRLEEEKKKQEEEKKKQEEEKKKEGKEKMKDEKDTTKDEKDTTKDEKDTTKDEKDATKDEKDATKEEKDATKEEKDKPKEEVPWAKEEEDLKKVEQLLMQYAESLYPLIRHSYTVKCVLRGLTVPVFVEGYIRYVQLEKVCHPLPSAEATLFALEDILQGYRRKFALFDISFVSARILDESVLQERVEKAIENVDEMMDSLYKRLHDTKGNCVKLARRSDHQSKLLDALRAHVQYLENKYGGAVQARHARGRHAERASERPEALETSAMNLSQHMDKNKTLIEKLELQKRKNSSLMRELFRLTEVRADQENQRMKGISEIIDQFQMNESFAEGIIKYLEHKLRKLEKRGIQMFKRRRGVFKNLIPNPHKLSDAINIWMTNQQAEISQRTNEIERMKIIHLDYQEGLSKLNAELNRIREEHHHLDRLVDNMDQEIHRKIQEILFKRQKYRERKWEFYSLLPRKKKTEEKKADEEKTADKEKTDLTKDASAVTEKDPTLPPGTPSVYHDPKSPSQFRTPAPGTPLQPQSQYRVTSPDYVDARSPSQWQGQNQITSPDYFDPRSPQPGPSRMPPSKSSAMSSGPFRESKRDRRKPVPYQEKPQVRELMERKIAPDSFSFEDTIDFDEDMDLPPQ